MEILTKRYTTRTHRNHQDPHKGVITIIDNRTNTVRLSYKFGKFDEPELQIDAQRKCRQLNSK